MLSESEGLSGTSGLRDLGRLSDLEHLLPQGLREALRPVERENARLLAALVRSRLCEEQLRRQNAELAELAELRALRAEAEGPTGASGVALPEGSLQSVLSQRGKDKALAELQHLEINLAEIVALTLLLRVRDSTAGLRQASVDALRDALEKCRSELASDQVVAEECHCHSDAVTAAPWTLVQTERDEAQRLRMQQSSLQEIGYGMLLTLSERCVAEEQTCVHEALGKLEAEEQLVVCESDLETEAALENDLQGTELRELGLVQQRLEESIRLTGDLKDESLKWKGQAEQCARLQRELADKAWRYSKQLEENALELEMEIEVAAAQHRPSVDAFHAQTVKPLEGAAWKRSQVCINKIPDRTHALRSHCEGKQGEGGGGVALPPPRGLAELGAERSLGASADVGRKPQREVPGLALRDRSRSGLEALAEAQLGVSGGAEAGAKRFGRSARGLQGHRGRRPGDAQRASGAVEGGDLAERREPEGWDFLAC